MGTVVYRYIFHLGLIGAYLTLFRWIKNKKNITVLQFLEDEFGIPAL